MSNKRGGRASSRNTEKVLKGARSFFGLILDHIFIQTFRFLVIPLDVQMDREAP